ncbi:MAG: carboxypeptidase regulatory-like domain-containing protein [Planctomycetes bacterium]|nr:carboxypeptidase regulatory-like domain-containing protein [Planctomycetota bacterium]
MIRVLALLASIPAAFAAQAQTPRTLEIDPFAPRFEAHPVATAIAVRVLDEQHDPVPGAEVTAVATPCTGYLGLFDGDPSATALTSVTDADGRARVDPPNRRARELRVRAPDGRIAYVPAIQVGESVTLVVAPPAEITLELVEALGAKPLAGVEVAAVWTEKAQLRQFASRVHRIAGGRSDADGRARIVNLPPGYVDLALDPYNSVASVARDWRVLAGETSTLKWSVTEKLYTFRGRVTDRAGNPVPEARVSSGFTFERSVATASDGSFEWTAFLDDEGPWHGTRASLCARADGFALGIEPRPDAASGTENWLIALPPGRSVHGRLVDSAGDGLGGVPLAVVNDPLTGGMDLVRGSSASDGSFVVHGLLPDVRHVLVAFHPEHALLARSLGEAELGTPDLDLGTLVMVPGATVAGVFVDADGVPIPRAEVSCAVAPQWVQTANGLANPSPTEIPLGAVQTDVLGRFRFEHLPAGGLTLTAVAADTMKRETVAIAAGASRSDVVIRSMLQRKRPDAALDEVGGTLRARVVDHTGAPAARVSVELLPGQDELALPLRRTFCDENGVFEFTGVHGAAYRIRCEARGGFDRSSPITGRRTLESRELAALMRQPAEWEARTIRLTLVRSVRGRVVDARAPDGLPWLLRAVPDGPAGTPISIATDRRGAFAFPMEDGARLTLWVSPLTVDPGVPRSALNERSVPPFAVVDVQAGAEFLTIEVPN